MTASVLPTTFLRTSAPLLNERDLTICFKRPWSAHSNLGGRVVGYYKNKEVPFKTDLPFPIPPTLESATTTLMEHSFSLSFDGKSMTLNNITSEEFEKATEEKDRGIKILFRKRDLGTITLVREGNTSNPIKTLSDLLSTHIQCSKVNFYKGNFAKTLFHSRKGLEYIALLGLEPDFEEMNLYFQLGIAYGKLNHYKKSLFYINKSLNLSIELDDPELRICSLNELGMATWKLKEDPSAIRFFKEALEIANKLLDGSEDIENDQIVEELQIISLKSIGDIAYQSQDFDAAHDAYLHALVIAKRVGSEEEKKEIDKEIDQQKAEGQKITTPNKSKIYQIPNSLKKLPITSKNGPFSPFQIKHEKLGDKAMAKNDYSLAIFHFNRADQLAKHFTSKTDENIDLYTKLGLCFAKNNDFQKANHLMTRALGLIRKNVGEQSPDAIGAMNNLGLINYLQKSYVKAAIHYSRAIKLSEKLNPESDPLIAQYYAGALDGMGTVLMDQKKYIEAIGYYTSALRIATSLIPEGCKDTSYILKHLQEAKKLAAP